MTDTLYFYSKSRDVLPGNGKNEIVSDLAAYEELSKVNDWRRILSNFHVDPFVWNGKTWNSIEHAFQASKIALVNPKEAERFTLESGDPIGSGDGGVAQKNRKLIFLRGEELRTWNRISMDMMEEIAYAKYASSEIGRNVLLATGDAELWHIRMRMSPIRFEHLERVRRHLRENKAL